MHLIGAIRSCVDHITQLSGIKSMVLDDFTAGVLSVGYSRSEMLLREVYIFERLSSLSETTERLRHVKCIVIIRPTKENIELLCRELNSPHYRSYHLYFTCRIGTTTVKLLSQADELEVVRCITELPLDFQAVTPFLFSLQIPEKTYDLKNEDWIADGLKRASDGLSSALIAIQVNPIIRYQTQSQLCKDLAERVSLIIKNESLANKAWRKAAPFDVRSLLLILDRRYDLVTPILNKWLYYPLIHEQFEIENNRINLSHFPERRPEDPKEMMLSMENDSFFDDNYSKNYGELGIVIKNSVENLKSHTQSKYKVETMEDMKRFINEYPETKRYAKSLHNHVLLMSELARLVRDHDLMSLSECEQELACDLISHSDVVKKIRDLVPRTSVRPIDALRLVSLYTVCLPNGSALSGFVKLLKARGDISKEDVQFVAQMRQFSLSKPQNPLVQQVNRMLVQVKGIDNVLTHYKPSISRIVDEIRKDNKLKESEFAFYSDRYKDEPPKTIIIFVVGGVTYEEAMVVDLVNKRNPEVKVIVGGTTIHNFKSFKEEVRRAILSCD